MKKISLILQIFFSLLCLLLYIVYSQVLIIIVGCVMITILSTLCNNSPVASARSAFYIAGFYSLASSALIFININISFSSMQLLDKIYWLCCYVTLFSIIILLICLSAFLLANIFHRTKNKKEFFP